MAGAESQIVVAEKVRFAVRPGSIHVSLPVERDGAAHRTSLECFPLLARAAVRRLRFRYTTDSWASADAAAAMVESACEGRMRIAFPNLRCSTRREHCGLSLPGRAALRGVAESEALRNYAFPIPDAVDLDIRELGLGSGQKARGSRIN